MTQDDIEKDSNDWKTWSKYVLLELRRIATELEKVKEKQNEVENKFLILNLKSGFWGSIGAVLTIIGYLVLEFLKKKL
jgi:hypothetical protein